MCRIVCLPSHLFLFRSQKNPARAARISHVGVHASQRPGRRIAPARGGNHVIQRVRDNGKLWRFYSAGSVELYQPPHLAHASRIAIDVKAVPRKPGLPIIFGSATHARNCLQEINPRHRRP
jgi:hypothetical protein